MYQRPIYNHEYAFLQGGLISGDKEMDQKEKLKNKLIELERKIKETENRLPAHSVKPTIMTELFELEDEYEAVSAQLKALESDQAEET
jgi:hypothetical protein